MAPGDSNTDPKWRANPAGPPSLALIVPLGIDQEQKEALKKRNDICVCNISATARSAMGVYD
eukprot:1496677-Karenia_brevis.AAC.1